MRLAVSCGSPEVYNQCIVVSLNDVEYLCFVRVLVPFWVGYQFFYSSSVKLFFQANHFGSTILSSYYLDQVIYRVCACEFIIIRYNAFILTIFLPVLAQYSLNFAQRHYKMPRAIIVLACISALFLVPTSGVSPAQSYQRLLQITRFPQTPALTPLLFKTQALALFQSVYEGNNNKCVNKLSQMANKFLTDKAVSTFLMYSGKGINDLGDYESCKETPDSYYLTVGIVNQGTVAVKFSFCIPNECPLEEVSKAKPQIAKLLSSISGMELTEDSVVMIDIATTYKKLTETQPTTIIAIVISVGLLFTIFMSSILDYYGLLNLAEKEHTLWKRILICFVLQRNLKSLLSSENRFDHKLDVFNGIRVLSIMWVVLGHVFALALMESIYNFQDIFNDAKEKFFLGIIKAGVLAVDVFFFLAGFLATLGFYKAFRNPKNRTVKNVLLAYFHRYVRLFPMFIFAALYTTYFLARAYDSPLPATFDNAINHCKDQWHWTFLYIGNLVIDMGDLCIGWVWYLYNDMQFYWVLPFFVLLYCKSKKLGLWVIFGACLVSLIIQLWICVHYKLNLSMFNRDTTVDSDTLYYDKPYCRIIPYLMGTVLFFIYEDAKDPDKGVNVFLYIQGIVQNNRLVRYTMYIIGWTLMHLTVYSFYFLDKYSDSWNEGFGYFQMLACRPVFIFGLCLVIYPVLVGRGQILLNVFGHPVMSPLAKLTYGTYMLHIPISILVSESELQGKFYTLSERIIRTVLITFLSYLASFVVTLIYESPTIMILKGFLEGRRPVQSKPKVTDGSEKELKPQQQEIISLQFV
eukprot:TRINITY_DN2493_c0_g1_i2.p1 TRINITY_DN2493_c0_g1~~TRINITY_DN2493_c0_g1_i2.p1  ORF type:complete len:802 (-),score=22.91 TRINITY_DN2493_c0_g1_i2:64-2469(-)